MPGETRSKSQGAAAKTAAAARTSPVLIPQGALEGQPEIPLNRPITTVGSNESARLHLLSRTVSKGHAIFVNSGGGTYVADLASRTGVLVNGKLGRDVVLKNGDRVQIGKFVFRYRLPPNVPTPTQQPEAPAAAVIVVGWPALPVTGRVVSIGRSDRSDIALSDDASVSAPHAAIFQVDAQWYIRDMGSRTGTHVNGKAIHQQALNFGDRVVIGSSTILFQPGAMIEEQSSILQSEAEEVAPLAATDDAIPLADDQPATEPEITQPTAVDWSATPATELPEEPAADLSTEPTEPLPVEGVEEHALVSEPLIEPLPLDEEFELPEQVAADLPTGSAETLPIEVESEPAPINSATAALDEPPLEPEPVPAPAAFTDALQLEENTELPAIDWGATPATELPDEIAEDLPTESSEPYPIDEIVDPAPIHSATVPVDIADALPAEKSVAGLDSLEEDVGPQAIDLAAAPAIEFAKETEKPPQAESVATPPDAAIPEITDDSDDDLIDWSLPGPAAVNDQPAAAFETPEAQPPQLPPDTDLLPEIAGEEIEQSHITAATQLEEATPQPAITVPFNADAPLPVADDSVDDIFDFNEPAQSVDEVAEPQTIAPPLHEDPGVETAVVEIIPPAEPEVVHAESDWSATPATELPAEPLATDPEPITEPLATKSEEETSHEPVPVDISESSWINTPTPPPVVPPPIPPLPTWPAATAKPAIDVHAPVDDFVFVPTDEAHDADPDMLFFGDESHTQEIAADPVLIDRLEHSTAVSPDAAFDSAIEDSLAQSASKLAEEHQHELENRPAHFDPAVADAAFDAALEESFAEPVLPLPAATLAPPEIATTDLTTPDIEDLDDRVAHFTAAINDPAFDAALDETFASEIPATLKPDIISSHPSAAAELASANPDQRAESIPGDQSPVSPAHSDEVPLEEFALPISSEPDEEEPDWLTTEPNSVLSPLDEVVPKSRQSTELSQATDLEPDPEIISNQHSQAAGLASATPDRALEQDVPQPTPSDSLDEPVPPISSDAQDGEPSWLTTEPTVANLLSDEHIPPTIQSTQPADETGLDPEPVDLHTLDLEDLEPETADANISWSPLENDHAVADEPAAPITPEPTASPLDESHDHSGEEAIGWSALVSHDDVPTQGVTTISDDAAAPSAQVSEPSDDLSDLDFLDFHDDEKIPPAAPPIAEQPLVPESAEEFDQPPLPSTTPTQSPETPSGPQGPSHGPSIFGFQFEGGSFLGGMPISLHQPEPPPVFDAGKVTPTGIGSMAPPPQTEQPKRKSNRPLTVPRPALPTIGNASASGKSLSGLVGEGTSTWAATPIIPPTGKAGERTPNRQKRGLTTAFNAPGMAAKNADVFSQLASPIGVEVFAGKPPAAVDEPLPELEEVEPLEAQPTAAPTLPLPQLKKTRRARWPWLVLVLGASVGGLWELAYQVPQVSSKLVTAKLVGSLQFDGFTSLSPVAAHTFLADQQARLASEDVRLGAQQILENNHQPAGFTASSDDYSKTVDMQSLAWSGNTLQLTFNTNDPVSGSAQVNAVLASLAKRDHDLDDAKARAKHAADDAHAQADAAAAREQQLSVQHRTQADLAEAFPDLSTVTAGDQDAATLTQKWNDAKITRENNESILADLRAKDPSKAVDVDADQQIIELRKRLDPLKEQIARLKGINALAATPPGSNAIPAGATTRPEGETDPLLAPLQQQADALAKKIDQRRAELAPDAGLSAAQREVDMANRIENLSVKITALRQYEIQAKTEADAAVAKAKQNHERLTAARLAEVKAEDLYNQKTDAESDHKRAVETQTDREAQLASCVTVAAVPIAPPTQFPATDIRAPMFAFSAGIVTVILGLMIIGDIRRPKYKSGVIPAATPKAIPPTPVVPWPRPRELSGLNNNGQPVEPPQEPPPIIGEPDQIFGV